MKVCGHGVDEEKFVSGNGDELYARRFANQAKRTAKAHAHARERNPETRTDEKKFLLSVRPQDIHDRCTGFPHIEIDFIDRSRLTDRERRTTLETRCTGKA